MWKLMVFALNLLYDFMYDAGKPLLLVLFINENYFNGFEVQNYIYY